MQVQPTQAAVDRLQADSRGAQEVQGRATRDRRGGEPSAPRQTAARQPRRVHHQPQAEHRLRGKSLRRSLTFEI